jgi:hypothetical protein
MKTKCCRALRDVPGRAGRRRLGDAGFGGRRSLRAAPRRAVRAAPQRELPACVLDALRGARPQGAKCRPPVLGGRTRLGDRAACRTIYTRAMYAAASGSAREGVTQKQPRDAEVGDRPVPRRRTPVGLVATPQRGGRCLGDRTSARRAATRRFPVMVIPIVTELPLALEPTTRDDFLGSQSAPRPSPLSRVMAVGSRA